MVSIERQGVVRMFLSTCAAILGSVLFGYSLGFASPASADLISKNKGPRGVLSDDAVAWFVSLINIGAIIGGPLGGLCAERLGRKSSIMLSGLPYMLGWLLIVTPSAMNQQDEQHIIYQLCVGRVHCGMGLGMAFVSVPIYVAEISTAKYRGFLGSCTQVAVTVGKAFSYILGVGVKPYFWLANVALVIVALMVVLMLFAPETPRWLLLNGQKSRARETLQWLRGLEADVSSELEEMDERLNNQESTFHLSEFQKPEIWKPAVIAIMILIFQQGSGVNSIVFYASIIVNSTHPSHTLLTYEPSILSFVAVIMIIIAALLKDHLGRRVLLLSSSGIITISLVGFGVFFRINKKLDSDSMPTTYSPHTEWLALVSLVIYMAGFEVGWGPIPFLIMSELIPTHARGTLGGIGAALNWTASFLVTYLFHDFNQALSYYGTFWLYAGVGLVSLIFVAVFLPETKGRTLEEIEQYFSGHLQSSRSVHDLPQ